MFSSVWMCSLNVCVRIECVFVFLRQTGGVHVSVCAFLHVCILLSPYRRVLRARELLKENGQSKH